MQTARKKILLVPLDTETAGGFDAGARTLGVKGVFAFDSGTDFVERLASPVAEHFDGVLAFSPFLLFFFFFFFFEYSLFDFSFRASKTRGGKEVLIFIYLLCVGCVRFIPPFFVCLVKVRERFAPLTESGDIQLCVHIGSANGESGAPNPRMFLDVYGDEPYNKLGTLVKKVLKNAEDLGQKTDATKAPKQFFWFDFKGFSDLRGAPKPDFVSYQDFPLNLAFHFVQFTFY